MQHIWQQRRADEHKHRPNDNRSPWQVDRSRIIHAAAFRRLQAKTQIMGIGLNDFYRTRLTHSLEVSQIGSGLLRHLSRQHPDITCLPDESLLETLCLAHDIGHPPFGHGGEIALNYMMREHGGFEGNAQTLRIVAKLEPYTQGYGMNLTRRTLLGFIKYPALIDTLWHTHPEQNAKQQFIKAHDWRPAKGLYNDDQDLLDWILAPLDDSQRQRFTSHEQYDAYRHKTRYKSLDAAIMELADDIAYAVHDLEDAIATEQITVHDWQAHGEPALAQIDCPWLDDSRITERLFFGCEAQRKDIIGELVNLFITQSRLEQTDSCFGCDILRYQVTLPSAYMSLLNALKHFIYKRLIRAPHMQQIEFKGQKLIMELFAAFASDPLRLLPETTALSYRKAEQQGDNPLRVLCDYLSGMTDEYAYKTYQRLFAPTIGV
ncbi:Deoxyguanosinetriphosphate triphosphohydrolase [Pseudoalteromonas sp. THAF3]|uniref:anti-phage deoxyguanosine triphosphatase n=1 Tax=Pseudoalteromonas sp. THAF3 TaxID=2587843 RepID=UPI001267FF2E|nr:anti-phage deoxyguanosine triphosphatase [Pseudoalteromonas sp. THAF3]QFU04662.1 Deoxyguanosinetriphosphate triphosphohydrolase [Pseudoalteromonas sp. THAF3]